MLFETEVGPSNIDRGSARASPLVHTKPWQEAEFQGKSDNHVSKEPRFTSSWFHSVPRIRNPNTSIVRVGQGVTSCWPRLTQADPPAFNIIDKQKIVPHCKNEWDIELNPSCMVNIPKTLNLKSTTSLPFSTESSWPVNKFSLLCSLLCSRLWRLHLFPMWYLELCSLHVCTPFCTPFRSNENWTSNIKAELGTKARPHAGWFWRWGGGKDQPI